MTGSAQRQCALQAYPGNKRYHGGNGTCLHSFFVPSRTEEIARLPTVPIPKPLTPHPKDGSVGLWEPTEWAQHLANKLFSDGS